MSSSQKVTKRVIIKKHAGQRRPPACHRVSSYGDDISPFLQIIAEYPFNQWSPGSNGLPMLVSGAAWELLYRMVSAAGRIIHHGHCSLLYSYKYKGPVHAEDQLEMVWDDSRVQSGKIWIAVIWICSASLVTTEYDDDYS